MRQMLPVSKLIKNELVAYTKGQKAKLLSAKRLKNSFVGNRFALLLRRVYVFIQKCLMSCDFQIR